MSPRCIVIASPNGSGKTTFARDFLQREARVVNFVNADLSAAGLSPLSPDLAKVSAGKLFLGELDRLANSMADFAFETTLSGKGYRPRFIALRKAGYGIEIVYLRLASPQLALKRIAARVRHGGHDIPKEDVLRRFDRSWQNFLTVYRPLADRWAVFDNSGAEPVLQEHWP